MQIPKDQICHTAQDALPDLTDNPQIHSLEKTDKQKQKLQKKTKKAAILNKT